MSEYAEWRVEGEIAFTPGNSYIVRMVEPTGLFMDWLITCTGTEEDEEGIGYHVHKDLLLDASPEIWEAIENE